MTSCAALVIVKATIVCGVALLIARLCRHTRASIRHLLFALAFAALAAIPVIGAMSPTLVVTLPATATAAAHEIQLMSPAVRLATDSAPGVHRQPAATRSVTIAQAFVAVWLIGVALSLTPLAVGFFRMRRLRQASVPRTDLQPLVESLAASVGLRRRIEIVENDAVNGPLVCGAWRSSIILPKNARDWDEASVRCALTHEIAHVARWDFLTHCLSRMVCAAYWFHPLVWAVWRRLRLEADRACDDAVVRKDDATDYASLLVSMARLQPTGMRPLIAMARPGDLAVRIAALLDHKQMRGRVGRRRATALIVTGVPAIVALGAVSVAQLGAPTTAEAQRVEAADTRDVVITVNGEGLTGSEFTYLIGGSAHPRSVADSTTPASIVRAVDTILVALYRAAIV